MPVYAELSSTNVEVAGYLIKLYSDHVGGKKRVLNQAVSEFEDFGYDYRFVRGLAAILDRRCKMETKAVTNPVDVRRKLFQTASEKGIPTSEEERSSILSAVAKELKVDVDGLMESMYGDLEDEMSLIGFDPLDSADLLKQYNLSLTQTLLFNASELSFTVSGNWQRIFRQIKWLGLIYAIVKSNADYWVKADGPTSLFKLTKRYGVALAKLLPSIIDGGYWRISAKVIDRSGDNRLLNLELDGLRHDRYMKQTVDGEEATFDSMVEEDFATRFKALGTGWEIAREPGPLPVGKSVMIPDFLFKKNGLKVYLEIVGFWTPEYLDDKMKKLSMVRDVDMVVAVDRRLACQRPLRRSEYLNLFYYKGKIPLKPIFTHLQSREKESVDKEVQALQGRELSLTSPVVEVEDIAKTLGISVEAVKTMMTQLQSTGYRRLGDMFIKETLLNAIRDALDKKLTIQKLNFVEASKLIESLGGKNPSTILEALGYYIMWHGINSELTEIRKKQTLT